MARRRNEQLRPGRYPQRRIEQRDPRPRFLIVCEGSKTEPNYFGGSPVSKELVDLEIIGYAQDPLNVVKYAAERVEEAIGLRNPYDQVWGVFDRDDVSMQRFNAALDLARRNKIRVAYSIEAFELWYLLHFNYHDTGIERTRYKAMLSKKLQEVDATYGDYQKNDPMTYDRLLKHQEKAIQNAVRLLAQYDPQRPWPYDDNPSTTVHLLVQELNNYARK